MTRLTNQQLLDELRHLLTHGAKGRFEHVKPNAYDNLLDLTKDWRTDIWNKVKELEPRLVPKPEKEQ